MEPMPEVTKNLLIINILMFIAQGTFPGFTEMLALYPVQSEHFQPVQLVTHMFMHGNAAHIFFNMFTLYMFGRDIEYAFGAKRFLLFYLVTGFGAAGLHLLVNYVEIEYLLSSMDPFSQMKGLVLSEIPMLGASGAIYGLLAAFGMLYPNRMLMLLFPPIPMKAKYFVLIFAAMELYLGAAGKQTGVAHFAHVGGALFGFLLILFWRRRGERF